MKNRRSFIKSMGVLGIGATVAPSLSGFAATQSNDNQTEAFKIEEEIEGVQKISIFQTTDVHCQLHPHDELFWENGEAVFRKTGGYAYMAGMLNDLRKIKSLEVYDTDTNFILIRLKDKKAEELKLQLFKGSNILIRDASNFIGLDENYIRIAIKSHEENIEILKELNRILGE